MLRDKTWSKDGFKSSLPNPFGDIGKEIEPDLSQLCGGEKRDNGHKLGQEMFMLDTKRSLFTLRTA